jgi:hypothetical protein
MGPKFFPIGNIAYLSLPLSFSVAKVPKKYIQTFIFWTICNMLDGQKNVV